MSMAMKYKELVNKLSVKDFGDDDIAVAIVVELLRQTAADIKWGRSIHSRKTETERQLAVEDARAEAIHMLGGLLGHVEPSAPESCQTSINEGFGAPMVAA